MDIEQKQIIKEILTIRENLDHSRTTKFKSLVRKYNYFIIFGIILFILNLISLSGIMVVPLFHIRSNEIIFMLLAIFFILHSYKIKNRFNRIDITPVGNLTINTVDELKNILVGINKEKDVVLKNIAEDRKNIFANMFTFIIMVLFILVTFFIQNDFNIERMNVAITKIDQIFYLAIFMPLIFAIGDYLGSQKKSMEYNKNQIRIVQKVKNSFIISLDMSELNPEFNNEKN